MPRHGHPLKRRLSPQRSLWRLPRKARPPPACHSTGLWPRYPYPEPPASLAVARTAAAPLCLLRSPARGVGLDQGYLLNGSLRGGVRGLGLLEQLQDLLEPLLVRLPLVLHLGCLENSRQQAAAVGGTAGPGRGRAEMKEGRAREGARQGLLRSGSRAPTHPSSRRIDAGHRPAPAASAPSRD